MIVMGALLADRRRVALSNLGRLFAQIDRAITRGDFSEAKAMLRDVSGWLHEAQATEVEESSLEPRESEIRELSPKQRGRAK
jgi:phage tail tape-measure protein